MTTSPKVNHWAVKRQAKRMMNAVDREAAQRVYRERAAKRARGNYMKRILKKHGMTQEQYDAMVKAQGGVCAICLKENRHLKRKETLQRLAIDHDHATGKVRGLLCTKCNVALGHVQDDPAVLRAMLAYLDRYTV